MQLALALFLCVSATSADKDTPELDFRSGTFEGWTNDGFYLTTATGHGPSRHFAVCSSDCGKAGRAAAMHRTFTVPKGAGYLRFQAYASGEGNVDVLLEGPGREFVTRHQRAEGGTRPVTRLAPPMQGKPHEYLFPLEGLTGQTVRLILLDRDVTPGRHLFCGGFSFVPAGEIELAEFRRQMVGLSRNRGLSRMRRIDSEHFIAISNSDDSFTKRRLMNCEVLYEAFLPHFQQAGFRVRRPGAPLLVAIFDTQPGFEAYFGQPISLGVTGMYHPATNRLVVYDYGTNPGLVAAQREGHRQAELFDDLDQHIVLGSINRQVEDLRRDVNVETVIHEAAHQLSFNCGLLNRRGDVPLWVAEGLATYCEPTEEGFWKGIGHRSPRHCKTLTAGLNRPEGLLPLRSLLEGDEWLRQAKGLSGPLGYAQSWALFRMLMEENPRTLKRYLEHIYERKTPDSRLDDFVAVFGPDLKRLEWRHQDYVRKLTDPDR